VAAWLRVCAVQDVRDGEPFGTKLDGVPVAIFLVGGQCYALHDVCTHEYARLSDGYQEEEIVECPLHQAQFDVTTGKCMLEPAKEDVTTYPLKTEGNDVLVYL